MNLLTLADCLSTAGGIERVHYEINKSLAARGHAIDLLYESDGDLTDDWRSFTRTRVKVTGLRSDVLSMPGARSLGSALRLGCSTNPDVVYACRHIQLLHAQAAGRFGRAPVICHVHTPPPRDQITRRHLLWLNRTTRFIFVSDFTAAQWVQAGLRRDLVEVIRNGIDTDEFRAPDEAIRERVRAELGIPEHAYVVLYLGRFVREKGIHVLLQAWRVLRVKPDEGRLVLLGGSFEEAASARTRSFLRELRALWDPRTTLWVPHRPNVVPMLWAADVVVVPSIWPDPFPLAVLEALACERPVVASMIGGIPEMLTGGLTSNLVNPGDVDSLAARLRALQGWQQHDPVLGQACRQHVLAHFSLATMVDNLESTIERLAERDHAPYRAVR
jgi:glycosyltransferase involved in cell wall biosynthesis